MSKQHQLTINLDEYVSFEQKLDVVHTLMELLDLEYDSDQNPNEQVIRIRRYEEDILLLVMEEFDRTYRK